MTHPCTASTRAPAFANLANFAGATPISSTAARLSPRLAIAHRGVGQGVDSRNFGQTIALFRRMPATSSRRLRKSSSKPGELSSATPASTITRKRYVRTRPPSSRSSLSPAMSAILGGTLLSAAAHALPPPAAMEPLGEIDAIVMLDAPPVMPQLQAFTRKRGTTEAKRAQELQRLSDGVKSSQDMILQSMADAGLPVRATHRFHRLVNAIVVKVERGDLERLQAIPGVRSAQESAPRYAALAESVPLIGANDLWARTDAAGDPVTGRGQVVAIIDTGVDYRHADLGGCLGPQCKVIGGWDFVNDDADPMDDHSHGTHVAGIVAAKGEVDGVAPDARLLAYKVLGANGSGNSQDVIAAIEAAADPDGDPLTQDSADVINLSLGGHGGPEAPDSVAVDNAVALGIVVVVAAGNGGPQHYTAYTSPGSARHALTVASSTKQGAVSSFSSRGPLDGDSYLFVKPDITAPGSNIRSTVPSQGYASMSGTSMASPHVAGAAALLRQLRPELNSEEIKSLLIQSASTLGENLYAEGAGLVDLRRAAADDGLVSDTGILHFGWVDNSVPEWLSEPRPIRLTNTRSEPLSLQLSIDPVDTPAGVQWEQPASIILAAGETIELQQRLRVDNAVLPYAPAPVFAYRSALRIRGTGIERDIPIVLHKVPKLGIAVDNATRTPGKGMLFSTDASFAREFEVGADPLTQADVRVAPGEYQIFLAFPDADTYLVAEDFVVPAGDVVLHMSTADADKTVFLPRHTRLDGSEVPDEDLRIASKMVSLVHRQNVQRFYAFSTSTDATVAMRVNAVSEDFSISGSSVARDEGSPANAQHYYLSTFGTNGIAGDLRLAPTDRVIRFNADPAATEPRRAFLEHQLNYPAQSAYWPIESIDFTAPSTITFHMAGDETARASGLIPWLEVLDDEFRFHQATPLFRPASANAGDGFTYFEPDYDLEDRFEQHLMRQTPADSVVENRAGRSAVFWAASFQPNPVGPSYFAFYPPAYRQFRYLGFFRDGFQNKPLDGEIGYRIFVDGREAVMAKVRADQSSPFYFVPATSVVPVESSLVRFEGTYPFVLRGIPARSEAGVTTKVGTGAAPYLRSFRVLDGDAQPTDHMAAAAYATHRIEVGIGDDQEVTTATVEAYLAGTWTSLPIARDGDTVTASFPPLAAGTQPLDLRVRLQDADGNILSNTISPAVVIDAGAPWLTPESLTLPSQPTATSDPVRFVTLSNTGLQPLEITSITPVRPPFSAQGGSCAAVPFTLSAGAACTLGFAFAPHDLQFHSQVLQFESRAGGVSLQLTGQAATALIDHGLGTP
jgi:subtilisin family serine protease